MLDPEAEPPANLVTKAVYVASAALAAGALRYAWYEPLVALGLLLGVAALVLVRLLAKRKAKKIARSGNVELLLSRWAPAAEKTPHRSTMAPLMAATAFTAFGWKEHAREAIAAAARGPAWDATLEHRLFLDTLLCTFEGETEEALLRAEKLAGLPIPNVGPLLVRKVEQLRRASAAFARAFAHGALPGDAELLEKTAETSPLVFWAMRYAAAVVAIDTRDGARARKLIEGAPAWPEESVFRDFHQEIAAQAETVNL